MCSYVRGWAHVHQVCVRVWVLDVYYWRAFPGLLACIQRMRASVYPHDTSNKRVCRCAILVKTCAPEHAHRQRSNLHFTHVYACECVVASHTVNIVYTTLGFTRVFIIVITGDYRWDVFMHTLPGARLHVDMGLFQQNMQSINTLWRCRCVCAAFGARVCVCLSVCAWLRTFVLLQCKHFTSHAMAFLSQAILYACSRIVDAMRILGEIMDAMSGWIWMRCTIVVIAAVILCVLSEVLWPLLNHNYNWDIKHRLCSISFKCSIILAQRMIATIEMGMICFTSIICKMQSAVNHRIPSRMPCAPHSTKIRNYFYLL